MSALPLRRQEASVTIEAFEAGTVDPELFDHEAHVYVGWLYLRHYSLHEAIDRYCAALRRFTEMLGIPTKYHETITWFFLILIAERMSEAGAEDWQIFKNQNPDVFATSPSIIGQYYSTERLSTPTARRRFVLPDLVPAVL